MKFSNHKHREILVVGIGNTGRGDDGLGWKVADYLATMNLTDLTVCYRYQLQVEDAHLISEFPVVIFADATEEVLPDGFLWQPCKPAGHYFYSSHLQSPETVIYLAETLYNKTPECYVLAIEGENWDLGETLSEKAQHNFSEALSFIIPLLENDPATLQPPQKQLFTQNSNPLKT